MSSKYMSLSAENLTTIAQQFPVNDQCLYLNHAAVAPWPKCTSEAVQAFAQENCQTGAQGYLTWLKKEQDLCSKLAKLAVKMKTVSPWLKIPRKHSLLLLTA